MNRLIRKIFVIFILIFILTFTISINVYATDNIKTSDYKPKTSLKYDDAKDIFDRGARVIKVIRDISVIVSVLAISALGFRYMIGSVQDKPIEMDTYGPVIIGCVLVASISSIITFIQSVF